MYKCPDCGSTALDVSVQTWAALDQSDPENFETDTDAAEYGGHEWDENSIMRCRECGHNAIAEEFEIDDDADEDEDEEDDDNVGDDICDQCGESGIVVDHTDNNGDTVCVRCTREGSEEDAEEVPHV